MMPVLDALYLPPLVRRHRERSSLSGGAGTSKRTWPGNLDAVALPGGGEPHRPFPRHTWSRAELDVGGATPLWYAERSYYSGEHDREHEWIQHARCGADELDIKEPIIAHHVWGHAHD